MIDSLPYSRVKIRVGALVFCAEDVALIRHSRPTGPHYTLPGGNVEPAEDVLAALYRELAEELQLDSTEVTSPELCWIQDQMVTRPGPTPPPRKLHLIFRCHIGPGTRATLATAEYDELSDGEYELGVIEWINYRGVGELALFPAVGEALSSLAGVDSPAGSPWLPPITDANYTWR